MKHVKCSNRKHNFRWVGLSLLLFSVIALSSCENAEIEARNNQDKDVFAEEQPPKDTSNGGGRKAAKTDSVSVNKDLLQKP